eukprot:763792-Hanusia_phi.AAC.4
MHWENEDAEVEEQKQRQARARTSTRRARDQLEPRREGRVEDNNSQGHATLASSLILRFARCLGCHLELYDLARRSFSSRR